MDAAKNETQASLHAKKKRPSIKHPPREVVSGDMSKSDKKKRQRRDHISWLKEIRKYQKTTDLLIRKLPFSRLVRQIANEVSSHDYRFSTDAIAALQEAAEAHLVKLLEESQLCTFHRKCITLHAKDVELALRIRDD